MSNFVKRHLAPLLILLAAGCSSGGDNTKNSLPVSPASANVLSCGGTATFSASGVDASSVKWSVAPSSAGSMSGSQFIAGDHAGSATVTASSGGQSGTAKVTVATAFPSAPHPLSTSSFDVAYGVWVHWVAASGKRVYAIWAPGNDSDANDAKLMIARSDNGGATWNTPVVALDTTSATDGTKVECAALAIDPGNPDVVYVIVSLDGGNSLAAAMGVDGETSALLVSTDGAATFKTTVMHVAGGNNAPPPYDGWASVGSCPDIASPSANTVVIESPGNNDGAGEPDMELWTDSNRGAAFATGSIEDGEGYLAGGHIDSLANVFNAATEDGRPFIGQNGGDGTSGDTTESPHLFTDGKGRLCVTYIAAFSGQAGGDAYVQCSDDAGKTFSAPLKVDPSHDPSLNSNQPSGAFGPNQEVALSWNANIADSQPRIFVAISHDNGQTFGTPEMVPTYVLPGDPAGTFEPGEVASVTYDANGILWLTYRNDDGLETDRVIVNKSCDDGKTWSGPILVNGPEGSVTPLLLPNLTFAGGDAPLLTAVNYSANVLDTISLAP